MWVDESKASPFCLALFFSLHLAVENGFMNQMDSNTKIRNAIF